ncbi:glycosyltransferase family 25 protein [Pannonibacter sp. Pt2]|uniref:Glycosyltransferase family 25 protein n=1 Tax=Pannonibacter anstelovis TaxID=3121537 RepID=A0ABU7ZKY0_9HYPH
MDIPIYLINLDRDAKRLAFVDGQLKEFGIAYTRFSAFLGTDIPDWLKPLFLDGSGRIAAELTAGEVGCYASHLAVMKLIAEGQRPAVVLEDDIKLYCGFLDYISMALASAPNDMEMLKLTLTEVRKSFVVRDLGSGRHLVKYRKVPLGAGAYLITPLAAQKFLSFKLQRSIPFDQEFRRPWHSPLTVYGLTPPPIEQNHQPSAIETFGPLPVKRRFHKPSFARIPYEIGWFIGALRSQFSKGRI